MRREKRTNLHFSLFSVIILSMILTACGVQGEAAVVVDHASR